MLAGCKVANEPYCESVPLPKNQNKPLALYFLFYLYIYPPDLQERNGGVNK